MEKKGGWRTVPEGQITVQARIDGAAFSEFAVFDVLKRQRRWQRPLIFALIFIALALVAFSQRGKNPQADLLGGVLLGTGVLLPAGYFLSFFLSVRKRAGMQNGRDAAYTLCLDEKGLGVSKGEQELRYAWPEIRAVYRLRRCICLYPDGMHAFLLPENCGEETYRAAWELIGRSVDPGRVKG